MAQLTVDLSADKATLARIAQLILQFAGYEPPTVAATPQAVVKHTSDDPMGLAGQGAIAGGSLLNPFDGLTQTQFQKDVAQVNAEELEASQVFAPTPPLTIVTDYPLPESMSALGAAPPQIEPSQPPVPVPPPPPPAGIDVDLRGLPWDPRIHASTRAKTAEGNWRQKRNVDPELMTKVETELRQTMGAPVPRVPAPPVPVPPPPFAGNVAPPAPPMPSGIPSVPASAGAATGASPGSPTFPQLMGAITHGFTVAKTITKAQVDAAVAKVGLNSLPMLASRPDLVGAVATELGLAL